MNALLYYLSLPFLYGLSLLPFWALYRVSDAMFVLLYLVFGYRKKVVMTNLRSAFPEKTEREIRQITFRFYRFFCDLILEVLKGLTISPRALRRCIVFEDLEVVKAYFAQKQSIIIVLGHMGNWELAGSAFSLEPVHELFVLYHPLRNPYFEKLIYHTRTRLGTGLYPMKHALRNIVKNRERLTATAFIADQTPSSQNVHWMTFMNQEAPVFKGTEKIARALNYPVVFISVRRPRRGQYLLRAERLFDQPKATADNEITEAHTRRLEQDIRAQPEIWLWTHRRWKHRREGR